MPKEPKKEDTRAIVAQQIALNPAQSAIVTAPTPAEFILTRQGRGGKNLSYVEGGYVVNQLNRAFSPLGWDFEVVEHIIDVKEVVVKGRLTIKDHKGHEVSKTQYGQHERHQNVPLGDVLKSAATDSLKKCASLLGIALDVYWKQMDAEPKTAPVRTKAEVKRNVFETAKQMVQKCDDLVQLGEWLPKMRASKLYSEKEKAELEKLVNERIKKA